GRTRRGGAPAPRASGRARHAGWAERRLASTQPAEPPPTTTTSKPLSSATAPLLPRSSGLDVREIELRIEVLRRRHRVLDVARADEEVGHLLQTLGRGAVLVELAPLGRRVVLRVLHRVLEGGERDVFLLRLLQRLGGGVEVGEHRIVGLDPAG